MAEITNSKLLQIDAGITLKRDASVVIVRTEWNTGFVDKLEKGCRKLLRRHQVKKVKTITVPGAVEMPFIIQKYWDFCSDTARQVDAFIALGCVIRGGTPHFEYVCRSVTDGITQLNLVLPVPVIFGVLTVEDEQQAAERLGGSHGHKGEEAALTAVKMMALAESFTAKSGRAGV